MKLLDKCLAIAIACTTTRSVSAESQPHIHTGHDSDPGLAATSQAALHEHHGYTAAVSRVMVDEASNSSEPESDDALIDDVVEEALASEIKHADAVLFPSLCVTLGAMVFYTLSRVKILSHALPYTAVMFLIGTCMGLATTMLTSKQNRLHDSVQAWTGIDSEVLLLIFLPGLIFKDSIGLNVHLFRVSLIQNFLFAFPLVLAGTTLTALVAFYIFPWNWSFNLCMTFGSILSATDPVAVAVLLNELGAPPRLKVHISGEALLNDGAAIVFYSIFVLRYLYEWGVKGVGEEIDLAKGVALFFRKALGGVAIGIFFGLLICLALKMFNRRFNREENVTEVSMVLGLVYVGYWCADYLWATSGVIATVVAGLLVKLLGSAMLNDSKLLDDFWSLLEHVLNTVLFTLGGVVWGNVLIEEGSQFNKLEWAYLILLYVMLTIIRFFLFLVAYPVTKNIGLGTCWKETFFQVHAGLRGAVGIALALSLDSQVSHISSGGEVDPMYQDQSRKVFGFVGGIAFITLVFNAPTCKPLLRYLKLSESTETRNQILATYRTRFKRHAVQEMVSLLSQPRFKYVSFGIVQNHVSFLSDLTKSQLVNAVERHKAITPMEEYTAPELGGILSHIVDDTTSAVDCSSNSLIAIAEQGQVTEKESKSDLPTIAEQFSEDKRIDRVQEFRVLFLDLLHSAYEMQIAGGELVQRQFLTVALEQSLDLAQDKVSQGEALNDWHYATATDPTLMKLNRLIRHNKLIVNCLESLRPGTRERWKLSSKHFNTERALAFMAAHQYAQDFIKREFADPSNELSNAGKAVLEESQAEWLKAEAVLKKQDRTDLETAVSHKFCSILLNSSIIYIGQLVEQGLLRDDEAEHWVGEVEAELAELNACSRSHAVRSRQCSIKASRRSNDSFFTGIPPP